MTGTISTSEKIDSIRLKRQASPPAAPPAGFDQLYGGADGTLSRVASDNTVHTMPATAAVTADLDLLAGLAAAGGSTGDVLTLNAQGKPVPAAPSELVLSGQLTDTQFKALPTTTRTLIPTPGPGLAIVPHRLVLVLDGTGGRLHRD